MCIENRTFKVYTDNWNIFVFDMEIFKTNNVILLPIKALKCLLRIFFFYTEWLITHI